MNDPSAILLDGVPGGLLDPLDRGLQYGDGLFETLKVRDGRPLFWERHLARLCAGCSVLRIPAPAEQLLRAEAERLCAGHSAAVLKIVITRGSGGRGYRPPDDPLPRRLLMRFEPPLWPARYWQEGVAIRHCRTPLGSHPSLSGLKHLNRLEQVLARMELDPERHAEGLMADLSGQVIEGTMTNLFALLEGRVVTPPVGGAGVAGITRARVFAACDRLGVPRGERPLTAQALAGADGLFLTNSLIGLWPVRRLEETDYPIPELTRRLAAELAREESIDG